MPWFVSVVTNYLAHLVVIEYSSADPRRTSEVQGKQYESII
jgi:hypothetical protein